MREEKKEYLKIGEYIPADEESGTPEVIDRGYYRQGWIFKDEEAYLDEEHPDRICYIPELSDFLYTRKDFLNMCNGQSEIADRIFDEVDWQRPETCLEDQWYEELSICPHCQKWYWCYGVDQCPYCGKKHDGNEAALTDRSIPAEQPWYTENWYMEDLENALENARIEVTEENLNKLLLGCRGIFDDKTMRNEMLEDKAKELFGEE